MRALLALVLLAMSFDAQAVANIRRWRAEPGAFAREVCGFICDDWQVDVLNAVRDNPQTALKACKGPGKTAIEAIAIWHFEVCFTDAQCLVTSITGDNLKDNLWKELAGWRSKSELLKSVFAFGKERITMRERPETWFVSARTWPRDADPKQQANTLAGLHAEHTFIVVDEVGDIPIGVVAAAQGSLSTGVYNRLLIAGNPTRTEGPLWEACTTQRPQWFVKEIDGDPANPNRAKRISIEWAQRQIEAYGYDSDFVRVNVRGMFPRTQSNKLIGPDECSKAVERALRKDEYFDEAKVLGIDCAAEGDDEAVFAPRQGPLLYQLEGMRELKTTELTDQAAMFLNRWHPIATFIDQGTFGVAIRDNLHRLNFSTVVGVDFGGKARDPKRFSNKRAEMYFDACDWVRKGGSIPNDRELIADLCGQQYQMDKHGRLLLLEKKELKKVLGRSPDRGDGFVLTFAYPVRLPDPPTVHAESAIPQAWDYDPLHHRRS